MENESGRMNSGSRLTDVFPPNGPLFAEPLLRRVLNSFNGAPVKEGLCLESNHELPLRTNDTIKTS